MLPNPLPRKLTQISEQALAPQQVPLILGQDLFLLTQQDVRKIEDSRLFSLSKLMPNGDLKLINLQDPNDWLLHLLNGENLLNNHQFLQLLEFLNAKRKVNEQCQHLITAPFQQCCTGIPSCPQPMEVSTTQCEHPVVASIEQQLQWNKCVNTSTPFPMTYSQGTSTTEINWQPLDDRKKENMHKTCCCCCSKNLCNKNTNTQEQQNECCPRSEEILGAREQLKRKKLNFNFNYLT
ncbi:uncharacterized protein LOC119600520 [Lucilia sericata]|uniref:uncharacterized protein LOC119600520 n=1 Tax=Lucilia sericata TaxID=13632 RepID=UPI0018A7EB83|nr:uncharacterized protein LOC119600520 [Lucilia sericata]